MIEEAKKDLKKMIIANNSEEYYYKMIADRIKPLYEFKVVGDKLFGKDDDIFRDEVIKTTQIKNKDLSEEQQLYELIVTEIVLDVFMDL